MSMVTSPVGNLGGSLVGLQACMGKSGGNREGVAGAGMAPAGLTRVLAQAAMSRNVAVEVNAGVGVQVKSMSVSTSQSQSMCGVCSTSERNSRFSCTNVCYPHMLVGAGARPCGVWLLLARTRDLGPLANPKNNQAIGLLVLLG